MKSVRIRGDGVAARACGHLLLNAGYRLSFESGDRPRVPLIMLSQTAQRLIADIFESADLFDNLPVIRKRIVAWGSGPVELDHSAVVVSEETLLARLGTLPSDEEPAEWTICAGPPAPSTTVSHRVGSRTALAIPVEMQAPLDACWMESLADGWLFLNSGWLLAAGAQPETLLEKSILVKDQIAACGPSKSQFPVAPRIVTPLGGDRWIACGSAAMAFDPLCGDGTAHAVREAILACAVIRAADRGEDLAVLMAHYHARLTAGFERHLAMCHQFYSSGGKGPWWKDATASLAEGIQWCRGRAPQTYRYRLEGLELRPIQPPAAGTPES